MYDDARKHPESVPTPPHKVTGAAVAGVATLPFQLWQIAAQAGFEMVSQMGQMGAQLTALWASNAAQATRQAAETYWETYKQSFTEANIERWIDEVDSKRPHDAHEETSPGGRYYIYMKERQQALLNLLPGPLQAAMRTCLMEDSTIQAAMRSDEMAEQFERIDPTIEKIYRKKYPELAQTMRWQGLLCDEQYNHKFLAETKGGKIVEVTQDEVASWFRKDKQGYPHVILTSSHAQGETFADVRSIVHGIESLVLHSGEGKATPKLKHVDEGVGAGDTVILYACDVLKSPWQNGAALLRRVNELKRIGNQRDTQFNYVSPGAIRLQKLMLKCKSEHPADIDAQDTRPLAESLGQHQGPITLRADAGVISHHFQVIGYSKGGNVISDAGRYGNYALTYCRPDGSPLFVMNPEHAVCKKTDDFSMSEANVRHITRGHAYMALAAVEAGLSEWDIMHGMVRKSVNNQHDLISAHHNYDGALYRDHRLMVNGETAHHGHAPDAFLGKRKGAPEDAQLSQEFYERGYMLENETARRYCFQYFAANYDKAALGHVSFNEGAAQGTLILESAPGTRDAKVMEFAQTIKKTLTNALGKAVTLAVKPEEPGRIVLTCKGADFAQNPDMLAKLKQGFTALRQPEVQGLVIAQEIIDQEIEGQLAKAKQGAGRRVTPTGATAGRAA